MDHKTGKLRYIQTDAAVAVPTVTNVPPDCATACAAGIGHANTGAGVLVSLAVSPGPSHKLPVLVVSTAGLASRLRTAGPDRAHGKENPDLFRIASEIDDLERCITWTWLELWERHHRTMGEILRAILEDERACLSSAYRSEL